MKLACILISLAVVGVYADEPEKLVNGIPTSVQAYPHVVSIRINNQHMCGGNIIDSRYVLTAAHCVQSFVDDAKTSGLKNTLTVVSGTTLLNKGGQVHKVSRMWYNEGFSTSNIQDDIGLLELAEPIEFNDSQKPIKLPTSPLTKNEPLTIVAWGATGFLRPVHNDLRKLDVSYMPPQDCQRLSRLLRVNSNEFCTLVSVGTGACNGDSGSGVVRNGDGTIVGLVSRGMPCARGYPDVFTDVRSHLDWIKQKQAL